MTKCEKCIVFIDDFSDFRFLRKKNNFGRNDFFLLKIQKENKKRKKIPPNNPFIRKKINKRKKTIHPSIKRACVCACIRTRACMYVRMYVSAQKKTAAHCCATAKVIFRRYNL